MGVVVRQKIKGEDKPWWVFLAKYNHRKSFLIGSKEAALVFATKIEISLAEDLFFWESHISQKYVKDRLKACNIPITRETIKLKRREIIMKRTLKKFKKWRKENESNHTDVS